MTWSSRERELGAGRGGRLRQSPELGGCLKSSANSKESSGLEGRNCTRAVMLRTGLSLGVRWELEEVLGRGDYMIRPPFSRVLWCHTEHGGWGRQGGRRGSCKLATAPVQVTGAGAEPGETGQAAVSLNSHLGKSRHLSVTSYPVPPASYLIDY